MNQKGVPEDAWREAMMKAEAFKDMPKHQFKMAWLRRNKLVERGEIRIENGLAWPVTNMAYDVPF